VNHPYTSTISPTPRPHWFLTLYKKFPQKISQKIFAGIPSSLIFALLSTENTCEKGKSKGV
jgi:hypothetical protein